MYLDNIGSKMIVSVVGAVSIYVSYKCYKLYKNYEKILENIQTNIVENNNVLIFDEYIEISYSHLNKQYTVRVPFSGDKIPLTTQYMVIGKDVSGNEVDLTQQPGIPYILSPSEMNLQYIVVYNLLEDTSETYYGDDIPMYGK
jgi:hypothetical protein